LPKTLFDCSTARAFSIVTSAQIPAADLANNGAQDPVCVYGVQP